MPTRIRNTEIYQPGERLPSHDPWIERIAWLMDGAIPVGRFRIGLDGILGLVPGFGDVLSAMISMLIVARAVQAGIPRVAVARMTANIAIDTLVGAIPLFGDIFDFAYKANLKNLRIYEEAISRPASSEIRHWGFFTALFLAVAVLVLLSVFGLVALIRAL